MAETPGTVVSATKIGARSSGGVNKDLELNDGGDAFVIGDDDE